MIWLISFPANFLKISGDNNCWAILRDTQGGAQEMCYLFLWWWLFHILFIFTLQEMIQILLPPRVFVKIVSLPAPSPFRIPATSWKNAGFKFFLFALT